MSGRLFLLVLELQFAKPAVDAIVIEQRIMCTAFHDLTFIHHVDHVGVSHGAQTVRDHQRGLTPGEPLDSALDLGFRF